MRKITTTILLLVELFLLGNSGLQAQDFFQAEGDWKLSFTDWQLEENSSNQFKVCSSAQEWIFNGDEHSLIEFVNKLPVNNYSFSLLDNQLEFSRDLANFSVLAKAEERLLLVEEFTGTWCGWCPHAGLIMDTVVMEHPEFLHVTVHWNDPLEFPDGQELLEQYANGSPSACFNRTKFNSQFNVGTTWSEWPELAMENFGNIVPFDIYLEVEQLEENSFTAVVTAKSLGVLSQEYRINAMLVEKSFSSSSPQYGQANFYDGFEDHPLALSGDPIINYEFKNVVRNYLGGAWGKLNSIASPTENQVEYMTEFNFEIPEGGSPEDYYLIGFVQEFNEDVFERKIVNSNFSEIKIQEPMDTMTTDTMIVDTITMIIDTVSSGIESNLNDSWKLAQNPASQLVLFVPVNFLGSAHISIFSSEGKLVKSDTVDALESGSIAISHPVNWREGYYFVRVETSDGIQQLKWLYIRR